MGFLAGLAAHQRGFLGRVPWHTPSTLGAQPNGLLEPAMNLDRFHRHPAAIQRLSGHAGLPEPFTRRRASSHAATSAGLNRRYFPSLKWGIAPASAFA